MKKTGFLMGLFLVLALSVTSASADYGGGDYFAGYKGNNNASGLGFGWYNDMNALRNGQPAVRSYTFTRDAPMGLDGAWFDPRTPIGNPRYEPRPAPSGGPQYWPTPPPRTGGHHGRNYGHHRGR